jgi:Zn-dependent membrane protease YugP
MLMAPAMIIGFVFMGLGMLVSWRLKSRFNEYSKIPSQRGLTGAQIAEQMLRENGIHDVKVVSTPGMLTDHYSPMTKTVNLSEGVYNQANAAAAAVAAHECGHAVQHAHAYAPLQWRSKMVPLQNISGTVLNFIMMISFIGGSVLSNKFPMDIVLWLVVICYGAIALFSIVTLPVEFDASKRALAWIEKSGTATNEEYERSKKALNLAAMTYVVAALGAIVTMLYFVLRLVSSNRD